MKLIYLKFVKMKQQAISNKQQGYNYEKIIFGLFVIFIILQIIFWDINKLWWVKTEAMMDAWSFEHILSWISVGFLIMSSNYKIFEKKIWFDSTKINTRYFDLVWVLFLAFAWETIEHYLEVWIAWETVKIWFQWVEYWPNRIIFDPLMLVFWYFLARKYTKIIAPARFLSVVWLIVHVFIFPHSMYLHEIF